MNTWYEHDEYVTHQSFNKEKTKSVLDMIAISKGIAKQATDCRVVNDGVRSDHSALCLTWSVRTFKPKYHTVSVGQPNERKILFDQHTNECYNEYISERIKNSETYLNINILYLNCKKK